VFIVSAPATAQEALVLANDGGSLATQPPDARALFTAVPPC